MNRCHPWACRSKGSEWALKPVENSGCRMRPRDKSWGLQQGTAATYNPWLRRERTRNMNTGTSITHHTQISCEVSCPLFFPTQRSHGNTDGLGAGRCFLERSTPWGIKKGGGGQKIDLDGPTNCIQHTIYFQGWLFQECEGQMLSWLYNSEIRLFLPRSGIRIVINRN